MAMFDPSTESLSWDGFFLSSLGLFGLDKPVVAGAARWYQIATVLALSTDTSLALKRNGVLHQFRYPRILIVGFKHTRWVPRSSLTHLRRPPMFPVGDLGQIFLSLPAVAS